ncbi:MAG: methyl-accepting chemotaxis protein [Clostridia bacterium]|nr:methyl-accepting chemotaxis protein [Clostridia bacterium]
MNKSRSLRMEIAIVIGVFIVIALTVSTLFIRNSIIDMVGETKMEIQEEGHKISDAFSDTLVETSLISSEQQLDVLNDVLTNYFKIPELAVNIMLNDQGLKDAGKDTSAALEASVRASLANVRLQSEEAVMFLYIGYEDKRTYTATGWETPEYDPTSRPWYQDAMNHPGEFIWTAPYIDFSTGQLILSAVHTVEDDHGDIVGVIGADVSLVMLQEMLNRYQVGETGYVIAIDASGVALNHPLDLGITDPEQYKYVGKETPIPEITAYINSSETDLKRIDYTFNGSDKIGVVKKVPGINATIMANFEKADVLALADESRTNFENFSLGLEEKIQDKQENTVTMIIFISLGLMVVLASIGYIYSNNIAKPIVSLTKDIQVIADGDFVSEIKTKANSKEIYLAIDSLKHMQTSLGKIVKDVIHLADDMHQSTNELKHSGEQLSESSKSVTSAVSEIAQGATSQASDSEESARAMQILSKVIDNLSEFNEIQIQQTATMGASNEKGLKAVSALDAKTNETIVILKETNDKTSELSSVVSQITGITETIRSIAEQTNLLALNASIEAARAGEAGRGFAVVADEIRKLAEETSLSTGQIAGMIEKIEATSYEVVEAINSLEEISSEQVDANKNVVREFGDIKSGLEEMIGMIDSSSEKVKEIEMNKNGVIAKIDNIVAVTEETAAAAEEVNASIDYQDESIQFVLDLSKSLNEKAERLNAQLKKFNV